MSELHKLHTTDEARKSKNIEYVEQLYRFDGG